MGDGNIFFFDDVGGEGVGFGVVVEEEGVAGDMTFCVGGAFVYFDESAIGAVSAVFGD